MIAIVQASRAGLLAPEHWLRNVLSGLIVAFRMNETITRKIENEATVHGRTKAVRQT